MRIFFLYMFNIIVFIWLLGCQKADFNDGGALKYDEVYLTFNHAYEEIDGSDYDVKKPVVILFLLDITNSMTDYINTVKSGIVTLTKTLSKKNYSVKIGFISYKDQVIDKFDITNNTDSFITKIKTLKISGGKDNPEAGLMAIEEAIDVLQESTYKPYLKAMVLVSDDLSHADKTSINFEKDTKCDDRRSCSIASTVDKFNSINTEQQSKFKLFYSVPETSLCTCTGYDSPQEQLDTLLSKSLSSISEDSSKGGSLGWEFTSNSLLKTLPNMIDEVSNPKLLCLIEKIDFNIDGKKITYQSSFEEEYQHYLSEEKSQMKIENSDIIKAVKSVKVQNRTITVTQSCFDMVDAEEGNFSSPLTTNDLEVDYQLEYKQVSKE